MAETKDPPKEAALKTTDHDRVVMASRKADGTPDQTADFTYIGDKETSIEATKTQLAQQASSAVDVAKRGVSTVEEDGTGSSKPDPAAQELIKAHQSAAKAAETKAKAEVEKRFEDVTSK